LPEKPGAKLPSRGRRGMSPGRI